MRIAKLSCILLFTPVLVVASETVSAEKVMGGAEILRAVLDAKIVSIEKVTVPPVTKITGFENGHVKTEKLTVINWSWGMSLSIEQGPVAVPEAVAARIRELLKSPDTIPDSKLACGYLPTHRIEMKESGHTLEIFVLRVTGDFEVYRDGVRIGGRSGDLRIVKDLDDLLQQSKKESNMRTADNDRATPRRV